MTKSKKIELDLGKHSKFTILFSDAEISEDISQ